MIRPIEFYGNGNVKTLKVELDNGAEFETSENYELVVLLHAVIEKLNTVIESINHQTDAVNYQGGRIPEALLRQMREEE